MQKAVIEEVVKAHRQQHAHVHRCREGIASLTERLTERKQELADGLANLHELIDFLDEHSPGWEAKQK